MFIPALKLDTHIDTRLSSSRRPTCIFRYLNAGMSYPGLAIEVKVDIWEQIGRLSLFYGLDALKISKGGFKRVETAQGNIIKHGISKKITYVQVTRSAGSFFSCLFLLNVLKKCIFVDILYVPCSPFWGVSINYNNNNININNIFYL